MPVNIFYPGINGYKSISVGFGHGIFPGGISLRIDPKSSPESFGNFVIDTGNGEINFANCSVHSANLQFSESSWNMAVSILDFRWAWKYSRVTGVANLRGEDGKIISRQNGGFGGSANNNQAIQNDEYTPQYLAARFLDALKVSNYDVSDMPNDARPYFEINNGRADLALAELCEQVGCLICPTPDGSVSIRRYGNGADLPRGFLKQISGGLQPPQTPGSLAVICGNTRFQDDIPLEGVGLDTDGKVKLWDDLSYKPKDGWNTEPDLMFFQNTTNPKVRELAQKTMYRWFRPKVPFNLGGYGQIQYPEQLILENEQVDTIVVESMVQNKQAFVFGNHYNPNLFATTTKNVCDILGIPDPATAANGTIPQDVLNDATKLAQLIVNVGFSIVRYRDQYIVQFNSPIWANSDTHDGTIDKNTPKQPTLFLRAACQVRDPATRMGVKYERTRNLQGSAGPQVAIHDEIVLNYSGGKVQNKNLVDPNCDYYLNGMQNKFVQIAPQEALYGGIFPVRLDGAIQNFSYTMSLDGLHTHICRNFDNGTPTTQPYGIRRLREQQKLLIDQAYKDSAAYERKQIKDTAIAKAVAGK